MWSPGDKWRRGRYEANLPINSVPRFVVVVVVGDIL